MKCIDPHSHLSSLGNFPPLLKRLQSLQQSCKHVTSVTTKLKKSPFFTHYPSTSKPTRFIGQMLEGAARPVGGSSEATIQLHEKKGSPARHPGILEEARQLVNQARNKR